MTSAVARDGESRLTIGARLRAPTPAAIRTLKSIAFVLALLPLARLVAGVFLDRLGANPIELITRSTGTWTLTFLLITLGVTPLRRMTGMHWLLKLRRMLGLFAFFYACLHFTTYIWFDQFFDWPAIWKDILKRRFIWIGFSAFLMLIPLAVTSNDASVRKLGGRAWRRLHRLVYVIAICGVVHYWWLVKKDITQPLIYAVVLAALLGFRVVAARTRPDATAGDMRGRAQRS
jgi:methionine sulfoxide reductase heme-binding subunit